MQDMACKRRVLEVEGPVRDPPFVRFLNFEKTIVFRESLRLANRSILELISLPSYCQISCPVVFCFTAANTQCDRPAGQSRLLERSQRFGKSSNLIHFQKQSVTRADLDSTSNAVQVCAQ